MSMYDVAVHRVMIFWVLQELAVARDNDMITVIWSIKRDARTHPAYLASCYFRLVRY